jgi:hypothetical protein
MHPASEPPGEIRKVGHKWFDIGMTIAILVVSVSSLIVAIVHSRTLERMADANARLVEANSWPFLSYNTANGPDMSMSIVNDGVGPAKIGAIEVMWGGRAHRNAVDFLEACCGFRPGTADVEYELIAGRVLRAGQSVNILRLPHTDADAATWNALNVARISHDLTVNVCYCSVFDQCWWEDVVRFSLKPRPADRCTAPAVSYGIPG